MRSTPAVALVLLVGCGGGASEEPDAEPPLPTETESAPACSRTGDLYSPGLERTVAGTRLTLVEAIPGPPARGDNEWVIEVAEASGNVIEGAPIAAQTWMPDFLIPGAVAATSTELGAGRYRLHPIHFVMPGLWEVRIFVDPDGPDARQVRFAFCID